MSLGLRSYGWDRQPRPPQPPKPKRGPFPQRLEPGPPDRGRRAGPRTRGVRVGDPRSHAPQGTTQQHCLGEARDPLRRSLRRLRLPCPPLSPEATLTTLFSQRDMWPLRCHHSHFPTEGWEDAVHVKNLRVPNGTVTCEGHRQQQFEGVRGPLERGRAEPGPGPCAAWVHVHAAEAGPGPHPRPVLRGLALLQRPSLRLLLPRPDPVPNDLFSFLYFKNPRIAKSFRESQSYAVRGRLRWPLPAMKM